MTELNLLLDDIEQSMKYSQLWQSQPPDNSAFDSTVPFFADRMNFSQWLQWVFIARFRALLEGNHPLPEQCMVAPMAEEALRDLPQDTTQLLTLLKQFDQYFDAPAQPD